MSSAEVHTCVTCRVVFKDNDIQREHYKSDWHRYNLKRKVAQLPSITAEEFNNRVLQQRTKIEESNQSKNKYCEPCRKNFGNENSYTNHLNSKRHQDNLLFANARSADGTIGKPQTAEPQEEEMEEVDSDEWTEDAFSDNQCLFCGNHSRSVVRNLRHMSLAHSFFIPDIEYCTDISGLITYLSEKIYEGFMCLWCNDRGKTFYTAESAQSHMADKGHCKMLHEGLALAEYADFYDYSTSYPAGEAEVDPDEEVDEQEIDGTDYQLVLPSGAVVGHRSLMRYYKQRLNPSSGAVVPIIKGPDRKLHKVLAHYRASGWTVAEQKQVAKRAKDIHYMRRMQNKFHMRLGVKANKLQTHYRAQVNF